MSSRGKGGESSFPKRPGLPAVVSAPCTLPGWVTGGLRCPGFAPGRRSPVYEPSVFSGTQGPLHFATPQKPPPSSFKFLGPVSGTHKCPPPGPPDAHASGTQGPSVPALLWTPVCAPSSASPFLRLGGRRTVWTQARPSRCGRTVRRVTGRASSSSRGRGHCRRRGRPRGPARMPNKPEHARRPLPCWWAPSGGA